MKKLLFPLLLISLCSCGGKQEKANDTTENAPSDNSIVTDSIVDIATEKPLLSEKEDYTPAPKRTSVPVQEYKVDYDSYPSETPKQVFLLDEFYGKYGPTSSQPLDATLNAFENLSEITDDVIAEIEQFYKNLDERGGTEDMIIAANIKRNLAFYKTIREYSEISAESIQELVASEYAKWNLLADKVSRIGIDIVYLTYFQGSMSGPVSAQLEASIQEIGFYNVNVLKCRLIRDSNHLKEGIPEKIAAEALCKTIDLNLEMLNRPEVYEGETREEYENSFKEAESDRKGLEELIEDWLKLRYEISDKVDSDTYRPYIGSTGVLLIDMAAEINM
ncbi:MAG: hypothetical protein IK005_09405 [Paludibacteraceae bacterium]|nr:hypothetical protein [Paludibacteraceae bacterium]